MKKYLIIFAMLCVSAFFFCGSVSAVNVNPGPNAINNTINHTHSGDTLNLKAGTYKEHNITVNKNLTIAGPKVSKTNQPTAVIDAQQKGRIFNINSGVTVTLKNLLIKNGNITDNGGGIYNKGTLVLINCVFMKNNAIGSSSGGAIINEGNLAMTDCKFTNNNASCYGGALYNEGNLVITNCILNYNTVYSRDQSCGGAICNRGTLSIVNSILDYNTVYAMWGDGGAIFNWGNATLTNCLINNNNANNKGGAINNPGILTITNSILNNNQARFGGAIYNAYGTLSVISSTLNSNTGGFGGAIHNGIRGTLIVVKCIIMKNSGGIFNRISSSSFTIINSKLNNKPYYNYMTAAIPYDI